MANQNQPPAGTVITSEVLMERAIDFVISRPGQGSALTGVQQADEFMDDVEAIYQLLMQTARDVTANRAELAKEARAVPVTSWVTSKTGTPIPGNPDESEHDTPGVIYQLRYHMTGHSPDGHVSQSIYTYDEAVKEFGEKAVNYMWGATGEKGTYVEQFGDVTYTFTTVRYPVHGAFKTSLQTEQQVREAAQLRQSQMDNLKGVSPVEGNPEPVARSGQPVMGTPV